MTVARLPSTTAGIPVDARLGDDDHSDAVDVSADDLFTGVVANAAKGAARLDAIGPQPDDAPTSGLEVHVLAKDEAPEFVVALHKKLGTKVGISSMAYGGPQSGYDVSCAWLRDLMPVAVREATGELRLVSTLSINPNRSGFLGSTYIPVAPPKAGQQYFRPPGTSPLGEWHDVGALPLLHDEGNRVRIGRLNVVTDELFRKNAEPHREQHLVKAGYVARDEATVRQIMCETLRIAPSDLVALRRMPGEKTGHVDMFVMGIGGQAMVPEIRDEALNVLGYPHERELAQRVRDALNEAAATLARSGATVVRLPMMAPVDLKVPDLTRGDLPQPTGYNGVFFSPANSLLTNVDGKKCAFVPMHAVPQEYPDAYRKMSDGYAAEWKAFFTARGFDTELVPANRLAHGYGLFRCLTRPIA